MAGSTHRRCGLTALLALFAAVAATTASAQSKRLTLDDIHGDTAVAMDPRSVSKWLGEDSYTVIEASATYAGAHDIVRYDTATGARAVLVAASALVPARGQAPLNMADYAWSPDKRWLLLHVAHASARRNNPVGDYWLLDTVAGGLRPLGRGLSAPGLLYAEFSPDGTSVAYVHQNDLHVESVQGGTRLQLTSDGSALRLNGRADVAYEEEFSLGKAFAWSPDSSRIAYWQFDTEGIGTFYMVRNTGDVYSRVVPQQYPKPGTVISAVRVGTVAARGGATTWFSLEGDPRQHYVPRMSWAANSSDVVIQYLNRLQNRNTVLLGKVRDGKVSVLFEDADPAWINVNDPVWVSDQRFTWLSERDGWRHLYTVARDSGELELRTPGEFDVVSLLQVDADGGYAYFIASPDNAMQRYLYRARLAGAPQVERLTPAGAEGVHTYALSPRARLAFHTVSRFDRPPVTDVVRLPDHAATRIMSDNRPMQALVASAAKGDVEFFKVKARDGLELDAWMMKPPGFDPKRTYPLLLYVYSEPAGQTVQDSWGGDRYLWHLMLTQKGYLVASVDSRGANSPRGRDWRKSIYRQIGLIASRDQADALSAMLASRPYIDPARVGVWGRSGGGAMTLNAMFRYPQLYAVGIAIASPTDQRLYNAIYQERYMGLPQDNVEGYRDGSPINVAQGLAGKLLLVHGTGDDNVHYQNMEQLVDRLIQLGKPFSMMAYPDRGHGISEKPGTRLHLQTMMTDYLDTHLLPPRP
jgi:dipeptidyl-peptidase-4